MNKKEVRELLLEAEENGNASWDIGYRGGTYGMSAEKALELLGIDEDCSHLLTRKVGAHCNYLGGGLRGSICRSDYSDKLPSKIARKIDMLIEACAKRYEEIENGGGLNEEEYPDGDTNWEAQGTNRCRNAGVVSAY